MKHSSYSPPQKLPRSPAKSFRDLSVGSYDSQGRACETRKHSAEHSNWTEHVVKFRDVGEGPDVEE